MARMKLAFVLLIASALIAASAFAASIPLVPGPLDPGNALGNENALIQLLNQNVATDPGVIIPKNVLDNSAFLIAQRGTGAATCGTTSGMPSTAYGPDRWACDVNEATGAGQLTQISSSPTPPLGALYAATLVRNSGSLTNPQCLIQEVPALNVVPLQGQTVDFSVYLQALAGLAADNGNQANLYVFAGTTADQGLGTMTTSVKAASVTASGTTNLITYSNTFVAGQPVYFTATTMPTGLTANQVYYVSATGLTTSVFSVANSYAAAIAGTVTPLGSNGTTVVAYVPFITPAWTGLSVLGQTSAVFQNAATQTLSATSWNRYSTGLLPVPTNAQELGVAVCFTPLAGSGGSTDGIAVAMAQLEAVGPNGIGPTAYQTKPYVDELATAQAYFYRVVDNASGAPLPYASGYCSSTSACAFFVQFPIHMRAVPTGSVSNTTAFGDLAGAASAVNCTGFAIVATAATIYGGQVTCTAGATSVAGGGALLTGASTATNAYMQWTADF
jgi:hypothetical protein